MAETPTTGNALRICEQCGTLIVMDKTECMKCGTPVKEERRQGDPVLCCVSCGKELSPGVTVCRSCGTRQHPESFLTESVKRAADTVSSPSVPIPVKTVKSSGPSLAQSPEDLLRNMRKRKGAVIATVAVLLGALISGMWLLRGSGRESALPERSSESESAASGVSAAANAASNTQSAQKGYSGYVVPADRLMPARVFGAGAAAPARSPMAIHDRVEEFLPKMRSLYSEKLQTTQELFGTIVVEFALSPQGRVSEVKLHTTGIASPEFLQLVRNWAQSWQFSVIPTGSVTVFYPVLFAPKELSPASLMGWGKDVLPGRYRMPRGEPAPIWLRPDEAEAPVGQVSPGLRIYVIGAQQEWLVVLSPKGKVGYMRREMLFPRVEEESPVS